MRSRGWLEFHMDRLEIVVPGASWIDVFSDDAENPLIPGNPRSKRLLQKEPAEMHLNCPSLYCPKNGGKLKDLRSGKRPLVFPEHPPLFLKTDWHIIKPSPIHLTKLYLNCPYLNLFSYSFFKLKVTVTVNWADFGLPPSL